MNIFVWLTLAAGLILVLAILVMMYNRRHMLFSNVHFTAETTMRDWQMEEGRAAMTEVIYTCEQKRQDDSGLDKQNTDIKLDQDTNS
ncbi:hypothetical protein ACFLQJ_00285 [Calditrichota bacterium]